MQGLRRWIGWAAFAFALATSSACGSRSLTELCKDACDEADVKGCPPEEGVTRCKEDCDSGAKKLERLAEKADCGTQLDRLTTCLDDNFDRSICADRSPCESEGSALVSCVLDYCRTHTSDVDCSD